MQHPSTDRPHTAANTLESSPANPAQRNGGRRMELVCPAGNPAGLKAAVEQGADCVYLGFKDQTNARNFTGLNFSDSELTAGIRLAHSKSVKVFVALNTYPQPAGQPHWQAAVDRAADLGVDAVIIADLGLLDYAARRHPKLRRHLSVQGSATTAEAINFYRREFGIQRAVLPRVLTLAQVEQLLENVEVEIEVFGFGGLCVMVEGRCALSSYVTGQSPNTRGVCSPAQAVRWQKTAQGLESRLNGVLIDRYADNENAGYPTLCKGRFNVGDDTYYAIEEPTSLNTLELLPKLAGLGIAAIKIEGRQRSPAYVTEVTRVWRQAIDSCLRDGEKFAVKKEWSASLDGMAEGQQHTLGAYDRPWR